MITGMYARLIDPVSREPRHHYAEPPITFVSVGDIDRIAGIEITDECVRIHWADPGQPASLIPFQHVYELIETE